MLCLLVFLQLSLVAGAAMAQLVCLPSSDWWAVLNTSDGETPCTVAQTIRQGCGVKVTSSTQNLEPPTIPCLCTQAVYDMYGACRACTQGNPETVTPVTQTFSQWRSKCLASGAPSPLPTDLPIWVSLVDFTDTPFNITRVLEAAKSATEINITTASIAPLASNTANPVVLSGTASQTGAFSQASVNSSPPTAPAPKKSNNIGPIVGGVVGGIVVLAAIGFLICFLRRRRQRARTAPSAEFTRYMQAASLGHGPSRPETSQSLPVQKTSEAVPLTSDDDGDALPAFTPGYYAGPVFEKEGYRADPVSPQYSSPSTVAPQHGSSSHGEHLAEGRAF